MKLWKLFLFSVLLFSCQDNSKAMPDSKSDALPDEQLIFFCNTGQGSIKVIGMTNKKTNFLRLLINNEIIKPRVNLKPTQARIGYLYQIIFKRENENYIVYSYFQRKYDEELNDHRRIFGGGYLITSNNKIRQNVRCSDDSQIYGIDSHTADSYAKVVEADLFDFDYWKTQ